MGWQSPCDRCPDKELYQCLAPYTGIDAPAPRSGARVIHLLAVEIRGCCGRTLLPYSSQEMQVLYLDPRELEAQVNVVQRMPAGERRTVRVQRLLQLIDIALKHGCISPAEHRALRARLDEWRLPYSSSPPSPFLPPGGCPLASHRRPA